ncbi:MAG TPA: bifunctional methylenetetrahydrofolate dehydrogenase/methenyltetrahydrofolate cyclohydrolase FolD [Bryobacteraceae bacterium]|nr:bifunctional methylenetetrahydrofolate dehydrogenase/methenyltetrahydrofolate cyclohydrolase FolD [Bryobacteraceae bacterium]
MAQILDGKWVRDEILKEWKPRVQAMTAQLRQPGLAVILVGNDPASEIYVRNKERACAEMGIYSEKYTPAADISTRELLALVESLNARVEIDGILIQTPLPSHIDTRQVLVAVRPDKDVDGFHPMNVGNLVANVPGPRACTPAGVIQLLKRYEIPIAGQHAVVIGRSDIVEKPMALMLLHENATVTICHSRTANLVTESRRADILVTAIGRPAMVTRDYIKPGATVIDVGMNRITDPAAASAIFGNHPSRSLIGDAHPVDVMEASGAYTPVPGGVGPLTIAMLMVNTIRAAELHLGCSA